MCSSLADYNVSINCGGPSLGQYEEDRYEKGISSFFPSPSEKWAFSSTGDFVGWEEAVHLASTNKLSAESIYSTARLAPLSLKYYGRCLGQGSYKVELHFAEIMLTADQANNTMGRRLFDIYIQVSPLSIYY